MRTALILVSCTLLTVLTPSPSPIPAAEIEEQDPAYYHTGELAGSLRSADPPPLFEADPQHLWNRLFAAVTIRPACSLPDEAGLPSRALKEGTGLSFSVGEGPRIGTNRQMRRSSKGCWISSSGKEEKNSQPILSNACCSSATCGPCSIF